MLSTAYTLAGLIVILCIGSQLLPRWKAFRFNETRQALGELRTVLQGAVADGGAWSSHYLTTEAKRAESKVEDLVPQLRDRSLRETCGKVLVSYRHAWASAPPVTPQIVDLSNPQPADPHIMEQLEREVVAADAALGAIRSALDRMTRLERLIIGK